VNNHHSFVSDEDLLWKLFMFTDEENDITDFVLYSSHTIMDGWAYYIFFNQLFTILDKVEEGYKHRLSIEQMMNMQEKQPIPDNINVYLTFSPVYQAFLKKVNFDYWKQFVKFSFKTPDSTEHQEEKGVELSKRKTCTDYFRLPKGENDALMFKAKSSGLTYYSLFCGILVKTLEEVYDLKDGTEFVHNHAVSLRKFLKQEHMGLLSSFAGTATFQIDINKSKGVLEYAQNVHVDVHNTGDQLLGVPNVAFFQSYGDNFYTVFAYLLKIFYDPRKDNRTSFLFTSNMGALSLSPKYPILLASGGPSFNAGASLISFYLSSLNEEGFFVINYVSPFVSKDRIEVIKKKFIENVHTTIGKVIEE